MKAVKKNADEKKVDKPMMEAIYSILYNKTSIADEINQLLNRPITDEFY